MSLASRAGVSPMMQRRTLAVMGDGGFWHNGLAHRRAVGAVQRRRRGAVIMKNGYTSATGTQEIISTPADEQKTARRGQGARASSTRTTRSSRRCAASASMAAHRRQLSRRRDARDVGRGVHDRFRRAQGHHRRGRVPARAPAARQAVARAARLEAGKRTVRVKYGVDEDVCSGDHSCIRLSGCPTLSVKESPDPLRVDPVATVLDGCVGCGLCGENAHAAALCPSFYRGEVIHNPSWRDRLGARVCGSAVIAIGAASHERDMQRPVTILIAALGGEGGGVLDRVAGRRRRTRRAIRRRARRFRASRSARARRPTTSRSSEPIAALGGRRPVLSLLPVPGCVDLVVASELLEAGAHRAEPAWRARSARSSSPRPAAR